MTDLSMKEFEAHAAIPGVTIRVDNEGICIMFENWYQFGFLKILLRIGHPIGDRLKLEPN